MARIVSFLTVFTSLAFSVLAQLAANVNYLIMNPEQQALTVRDIDQPLALHPFRGGDEYQQWTLQRNNQGTESFQNAGNGLYVGYRNQPASDTQIEGRMFPVDFNLVPSQSDPDKFLYASQG
ncbi:hypothetical protein FRC09_003261 [Ceratobasidium sp. 395]|nr:hypothetical protein FRC09_003261 [Ceratobasidium sp. 395]